MLGNRRKLCRTPCCHFDIGTVLALKSEGIGFAVMAELPLVVIDVQRGGASTGLPTKTEQTDLMHTLYYRNGESPLCAPLRQALQTVSTWLSRLHG